MKKHLLANQRGGIVLGLLLVLCLLYILLLTLSFRGWGYAGYGGGRSYAPSFFYFGTPEYYGGSSVRGGSAYGPSHLGGGPGSGK